jgi:hypothetical protein
MERTPPKFLFVFANSDGRLYQLSAEREDLKKIFQPHEATGLVIAEWLPDATIDDLTNAILDARNNNIVEVIHFGGHSNPDGIHMETSQGASKQLLSGPIAEFIAQQQKLKFVFLNSCYSQHLAMQLVEHGVPCVVGTTSAVDDGIAKGFAATFYQALLGGADTIISAFDKARSLTKARYGYKVKHTDSSLNSRDMSGSNDKIGGDQASPFKIFTNPKSNVASTWTFPRLKEVANENSTGKGMKKISVKGDGSIIADNINTINQNFGKS